MPLIVDARIAVLLNVVPGPEDAVLAEQGLATPAGVSPDAWFETSMVAHLPGCACCAVRGPVALALAGLFAARARGSVRFFRRVVVLAGPAGEAELRAVLDRDPLVGTRYRLDA